MSHRRAALLELAREAPPEGYRRGPVEFVRWRIRAWAVAGVEQATARAREAVAGSTAGSWERGLYERALAELTKFRGPRP